MQNTTLDDIAGVVGFSATLRLAAWYGNGNNLFIPSNVDDGQVLVRLIGRAAAERLTKAFPQEWLAVPRLTAYDEDVRRHRVACMLEKGFSTREVSRHERMSERRVQQLCRELELAGIITPIGAPTAAGQTWAVAREKSAGEMLSEKWYGKSAQGKGPSEKPARKSAQGKAGSEKAPRKSAQGKAGSEKGCAKAGGEKA